MATANLSFDSLGRIEALDEHAESLFGHRATDVVRRERVSALVYGRTVFEQLPGWLETASRDGAWEGDALCRHQDGRLLPCHLRITSRDGGFDQEATLLDVDANTLIPPRTLGSEMQRLVAVTRLPFVTASLTPVLLGVALMAWSGAPLSVAASILVVLSTLLLHLGANTANDWFDRRSGTDALNHDYVAPFSGGSRVVELGLISERGQLQIVVTCFLLGGIAGAAVVVLRAPGLVWVGLAGAFLGFAYTAPPLRLVARRGLGELAILLAFGPLPVLAGFAAGGGELSWQTAVVGVPMGLWTTAILWANQIPDVAGDQAAGKWNLVALLGRRRAAPFLAVLLAAGHLGTVCLVISGLLPWPVLASLLVIPLAWVAARTAMQHAEGDGIAAACSATVQHQFAASVLMLLPLALFTWLS